MEPPPPPADNAVITWTVNEGIVNRALIKGIDIKGDATFRDQTVAALQKIASIPTGNLLLRSLIARIQRSEGKIGIIIGIPYDDRSHCDARNVDDARTELSRNLRAGNTAAIIRHMQEAMIDPAHDAAWLAGQLRNTPDYCRDGPVAVGQSSLPITANDIRLWVQGIMLYPAPYTRGNAPFILNNSLLIVLARESALAPGAGSSSNVFWSRGGFIILTDGTQQIRPAWVGLAHELIHAYYNINGTQLAEVESDQVINPPWTMMLGEYMCVGLGPWANAPISENRIRAEDHVPLRVMY